MKDVTLTFTQAHLTLINAAIQELPFKHAAPLINEINRQIAEQREMEADVANDTAMIEADAATTLQ